MAVKTFTYRVYPNRGRGWRGRPWQRGDGVGGLWQSRPFHRGDGFGNFLGRMTKKFLPLAGKFAKKSINRVNSCLSGKMFPSKMAYHEFYCFKSMLWFMGVAG